MRMVFHRMLKDAGVVLRAYTWLPEDADSPHTELVDLASTLSEPLKGAATQLIRPTRPFARYSSSGSTTFWTNTQPWITSGYGK